MFGRSKIGSGAFENVSAVGEIESLGGQSCHLAYGFGQRKEAFFAAVVAEDARKGSPQAGMWTRIVGQAIGSNHGCRMLENAAHIVF